MSKKIGLCIFLALVCFLNFGCSTNKDKINNGETNQEKTSITKSKTDKTKIEELNNKPILEDSNNIEVTANENSYQFIIPKGNTLATRIAPPQNYKRINESEQSFITFMRKLTLKEDGSPVLLFDGKEKENQLVHVAAFDIDIGKKDLQQCADSIIRVYAEYYWSTKEYNKIAFHLTNGFLMEYTKWREGYRLSVNGNNTTWTKSSSYDDSYENFREFLDTVYIYAGTLSLSSEGSNIDLTDIEVGDMFIQGGSPGHCVLVIDITTDEHGNKAFLFAQGYMPAQDFHVLKNPQHEEDPWYYSDEISYPLKTPQWTFEVDSLKRWF